MKESNFNSENHCEDFGHTLNMCTQAYAKKDFRECLYAALNCFNLAMKSGEPFKIIATLRLVRFSSETLLEELCSQTASSEIKWNDEKCSFCKTSDKSMKFIQGIDVRICYKCVEAMYSAIHENDPTS
jgi:hypothetical protein